MPRKKSVVVCGSKTIIKFISVGLQDALGITDSGPVYGLIICWRAVVCWYLRPPSYFPRSLFRPCRFDRIANLQPPILNSLLLGFNELNKPQRIFYRVVETFRPLPYATNWWIWRAIKPCIWVIAILLKRKSWSERYIEVFIIKLYPSKVRRTILDAVLLEFTLA